MSGAVAHLIEYGGSVNEAQHGSMSRRRIEAAGNGKTERL
jgi:hypothetical protein